MQLKIYRIGISFLAMMFMVGCRESITETAPDIPPLLDVTLTPDLCDATNLPLEVEKVNAYMREFDDYAALASNTPQAQLVTVIPEMQRVLRAAQDQSVPPCLSELKGLQIGHMQTVVQTLIAFVGNSDANLVAAGIAQARELHARYDIEMARLLGITLSVPSPVPVETQSTTAPTEVSAVPTPTLTPTVTNRGTNELNLRAAPDFFSPAITVLAVGDSVVAVGRTADDQWIQIQLPDQSGANAWVFASVVELSVPIETLPIVTP